MKTREEIMKVFPGCYDEFVPEFIGAIEDIAVIKYGSEYFATVRKDDKWLFIGVYAQTSELAYIAGIGYLKNIDYLAIMVSKLIGCQP